MPMSEAEALGPSAPRDLAGAVHPWSFRAPRIWLVIAAWIVLVAATFPFDTRISAWAQQAAPEKTWTLRVMKVARYPFDWRVYLGVAALLAIHPERRRILTGYAVACAAGFGTVHLLKFVIGRARPDAALGPVNFDAFSAFDSLPSAHTAAAVLLTGLMYRYYPRSAWVLIPLAVLASLSRVVQGRHYMSDVIAGAGLILLIVQLCVSLLGREYYPRLRERQAAAIPPAAQT
jgi:membrane-associated phospholipid phosphatase